LVLLFSFCLKTFVCGGCSFLFFNTLSRVFTQPLITSPAKRLKTFLKDWDSSPSPVLSPQHIGIISLP